MSNIKTPEFKNVAKTVQGYAYTEGGKLKFSETPVWLNDKQFKRIETRCDRRNLSLLTPVWN